MRSKLLWLAAAACLSTPALIIFPAVAGDSPASGQRLRQLSPAQIEELRRKQANFSNLSPDEQNRLRSLHAELARHPEAERLRQVMDRYCQWLKTLPAGQRAELLGLPATQRIEKIRAILQRQEEDRFKRYAASYLKAEDHRAIVGWLMSEVVTKHEKELTAALVSEDLRKRLPEIPDMQRRWILLGATRSLPMEVLEQVDLAPLAERLSEAARKKLQDESQPRKKLLLVREWIRAVVFSRSRGHFSQPRAPIPHDELMKFYEKELDTAAKEYLNSLPAEQMKRELERWYLFRKSRSSGKLGREGGMRNRDGGPRRGRLPPSKSKQRPKVDPGGAAKKPNPAENPDAAKKPNPAKKPDAGEKPNPAEKPDAGEKPAPTQ